MDLVSGVTKRAQIGSRVSSAVVADAGTLVGLLARP